MSPQQHEGTANLSETKALCPHGHLQERQWCFLLYKAFLSGSHPLASCNGPQVMSHMPSPLIFKG